MKKSTKLALISSYALLGLGLLLYGAYPALASVQTVPWNYASSTNSVYPYPVSTAKVGIGTTTPFAQLSVNGNSLVTGISTASIFVATSTTATSTAANGWNLTGGCFSINNVCVGGSSGGSGVTQVSTDATLTGGPITTTGTLGLNLANINSWSARQSFANASTTLISLLGTVFDTSGSAGTAGRILMTTNTGVAWVATTTFSSPLVYTSGAVTCPTCNTSSGSVSSVATNNGLTGGTITTTGTIGLDITKLRTNNLLTWDGSILAATGTPALTAGYFIATTTTASQLPYASTTAIQATTVYAPVYAAFSYATSTAWTGTTTLPLGTAYISETWTGVQCFTDAGTLNVSFNNGGSRLNMLNASTTVGTFGFTTNQNIFTAATKRFVDVGTPASSPTKISCTVNKQPL